MKPAEKLFTNISNPGRILGCTFWSNFFINQAANGPMTIAPIIMVTSDPAIAPNAAIAPTIPPLCE